MLRGEYLNRSRHINTPQEKLIILASTVT
jgi:hypothetical protein